MCWREIMSKETNSGSMDGVMSKGYGTIPKLIMQHENLSIEAKAIYAYLASYAGAGDTAYPSVSIMCKHLGISRDRFYRHRKALLDNDFIRIERNKNEGEWSNNLYTVVSMPRPQNKDTENKDTQNKDTENKDTINNSSINNSINKNSTKDHSTAKAERIPYKKIIDYLNEQTGRRYSHTANKNQDLIRARWNEGFRVDDFKQVIDTKVVDWGSDPKMNKYLRPITLFSNKFDEYLNQSVITKKDARPTNDNYIDDWDDFEKMIEGD